MVLKIDRGSKRVWVFGRRTHHALLGFGLVGVGVALIIHDRHDWRLWLADLLVITDVSPRTAV